MCYLSNMVKYPLILFDGVCNLCNGTIDFVLNHDKRKHFRFVPLQSEAGKKVIEKLHLSAEADGVVFYFKKKVYTESDAVIEIVRFLPAPWKWFVIIKIIPKNGRDRIYKWIAKNRYKRFGEKQTCRVPTPQEKQFFPEAEDLHI